MLEVILGLIGLSFIVVLGLKIWRDPNWGILTVFFLLPFERIPTVDVAGFTLKLNHLVGSILMLIWFLKFVKSRTQFVSHPTNTFMWLLIASFTLSFAGAVSPFRSAIFFGQALFVLGLYGVIVQSVRSERMVEKIINILTIVSWIVVIFALFQFIGDYLGLPTGLDQGYTKKVLGFPRPQAFSKEPLYLANFLFIPLGIIVGYLLQSQKSLPRSAVMLFPFIILVFLLTVSRGAYLGLLVFGLVLITLTGNRLLSSRAFQLASFALIGAFVALIITLVAVGPQIASRFIAQATVRDVELSSESIFGRLRAYGQAIEVWRSSPVTGVGLGGFGPASGSEISTGYGVVNNQYLEILAESGIVGLTIFLMMLISIFVVFAKIYLKTHVINLKESFLPNLLIGLIASFAAIFAQYNFFSTFAIIHIWVMVGFVVGVESIILKQIKDKL